MLRLLCENIVVDVTSLLLMAFPSRRHRFGFVIFLTAASIHGTAFPTEEFPQTGRRSLFPLRSR